MNKKHVLEVAGPYPLYVLCMKNEHYMQRFKGGKQCHEYFDSQIALQKNNEYYALKLNCMSTSSLGFRQGRCQWW